MCYTYILHSKTFGKFYIGFTCDDINERIRRHNSHHTGFTSNASDWKLVYQEQNSKEAAIKLEQFIKKRGAKRFLMDNGLLDL